MLNHKFRALRKCCLLIFSIILLFQPVSQVLAADAERERTLIIGKVSSNPKKHYRYLKPIADYAVRYMQDLGIDRVKVLMAKNNRQMIRYLKQGKVDWITETVFSAVQFEEQAGAEMLLYKHKKGMPLYHTVFFAREGSGIKNLQDLKGKVITFQDPGSTSGFFIPASVILKSGLELVLLKSSRETAPDDAVGYVFAKEEINMSTWVHKGIVPCGAYANLDWDKEDHTPAAFKKNMYIFHSTDEFPRAVDMVRKDLRPEVKERLKSVLLSANDDPDAALALQTYQRTARFDIINEQTIEGIERTRKILKTLKGNLDF